jgi:hypothetical protein
MSLASTEWVVGIALGVAVIAVAAAILIMIVALSQRIAKQAATAEEAVEVVRAQTDELSSSGSSSSISRGASEPPRSAGTTPSPDVPAHSPLSRASATSGVVPPRCSLGVCSSVIRSSSSVSA